MPLTDKAARAAKPREKTYEVSDERGMYLEVTLQGGRYWRLKCRFSGREKRLALGVYPNTLLADAREKREVARKQLANGRDPSESQEA